MFWLVPVEAEYLDDDGISVWVLVHVNRRGVMRELENLPGRRVAPHFATAPERLEPFSKDYGALYRQGEDRRGA